MFSFDDMNRCAALNRRVLVEHDAKETGNARGEQTHTKLMTAVRSSGCTFRLRPWRAKTAAAMVMEMGTSHATCSFHSIPMEGHAMVDGLDTSRRCGNAARLAVPAGGTARYQG